MRSLAVRDILYHQIHKSVEQKEFTTHVYVPIKDFFVILNISLCFPFREGNLNECCKIVTYVVVETLWGVVWTSFESSIEIFLLYLCDQKVSPTQVEKKTNQIAAAASWQFTFLTLSKCLATRCGCLIYYLWLLLSVRGAFCNATHIATFIALHS